MVLSSLSFRLPRWCWSCPWGPGSPPCLAPRVPASSDASEEVGGASTPAAPPTRSETLPPSYSHEHPTRQPAPSLPAYATAQFTFPFLHGPCHIRAWRPRSLARRQVNKPGALLTVSGRKYSYADPQ